MINHPTEYTPSKNWHPMSLSFSNFLCYGENNHIDFTKAGKNKCLGLCSNATGKSSIIDALIYSLYGTGVRTNNIKSYVRVGDGNKDFETCLDFFVDWTIYRIIRQYIDGSTRSRLFMLKDKSTVPEELHLPTSESFLQNILYQNLPFKVKNDKIFVEICNTVETDALIKKMLGSKRDLLMTNIISHDSIPRGVSWMSLSASKQIQKLIKWSSVNTFLFTAKLANWGLCGNKFVNFKYTEMMQSDDFKNFILKDLISRIENHTNELFESISKDKIKILMGERGSSKRRIDIYLVNGEGNKVPLTNCSSSEIIKIEMFLRISLIETTKMGSNSFMIMQDQFKFLDQEHSVLKCCAYNLKSIFNNLFMVSNMTNYPHVADRTIEITINDSGFYRVDTNI